LHHVPEIPKVLAAVVPDQGTGLLSTNATNVDFAFQGYIKARYNGYGARRRGLQSILAPVNAGEHQKHPKRRHRRTYLVRTKQPRVSSPRGIGEAKTVNPSVPRASEAVPPVKFGYL
jgi:hypothetical protein